MSSHQGPNRALERVWAQARDDPRAALEERLIPSDLHTLLMSVARRRAAAVTPARLMRRWADDPYVEPAAADPRSLWKLEARLWELLPHTFEGVDLSPVTPLGTCSATAGVDQNRVMSTVRGSEVVSDPTNVLALEAARRRRASPDDAVRLASCHRVLRAQRFDGPGLLQHFRLFVLTSSDRDRGSGSTEAAMLIDHFGFWARALGALLGGGRVVIEFSAFDSPVLTERFRDVVRPALDPLPPNVVIVEEPDRQRARGYYTAGAIRIEVVAGGEAIEIGDGGFTGWTAKLTADAKERCFTSCISTERLVQLLAPIALS